MNKILVATGATALLVAGGLGGAVISADTNLWGGSQNLAHTRAILGFMSDKLYYSMQDLKTSQAQNTKVQAQLVTAQANANKLQAQVNDLSNKLAAVPDTSAVQAQLADAQAKLQASTKNVNDLQAKLTASDAQVKAANTKITDLQGKYDAANKQVGDTNVVNKNLQQQLDKAVSDAQATSKYADDSWASAFSDPDTRK